MGANGSDEQEIVQLRKQINEKESEILKKDAELKSKDEKLQLKDKELQSKDQWALQGQEDLRDQVNERDNKIRLLEKKFLDKKDKTDQEIELLQKKISDHQDEKKVSPLRQLKANLESIQSNYLFQVDGSESKIYDVLDKKEAEVTEEMYSKSSREIGKSIDLLRLEYQKNMQYISWLQSIDNQLSSGRVLQMPNIQKREPVEFLNSSIQSISKKMNDEEEYELLDSSVKGCYHLIDEIKEIIIAKNRKKFNLKHKELQIQREKEFEIEQKNMVYIEEAFAFHRETEKMHSKITEDIDKEREKMLEPFKLFENQLKIIKDLEQYK